MAKALLIALAMVGLVFPSANVCLQAAGNEYVMRCCESSRCPMGTAMRDGSCCKHIAGSIAGASLVHPTPCADLVAEPATQSMAAVAAFGPGAFHRQAVPLLPAPELHRLQI